MPRLGRLSERFESGGRGPGTVSGGAGDPGGVSYGTYQLSSRTGTAARFIETEGAPWAERFGAAAPGSAGFSRAWRVVAESESERFGAAQHAFIERTHYQPAVRAVLAETGLDLDSRHCAVRDAVWSVAVQHGRAAKILAAAVMAAKETALSGDGPAFDRALLDAIYAMRSDYVLRVAERPGRPLRAPCARSCGTAIRLNWKPRLRCWIQFRPEGRLVRRAWQGQ